MIFPKYLREVLICNSNIKKIQAGEFRQSFILLDCRLFKFQYVVDNSPTAAGIGDVFQRLFPLSVLLYGAVFYQLTHFTFIMERILVLSFSVLMKLSEMRIIICRLWLGQKAMTYVACLLNHLGQFSPKYSQQSSDDSPARYVVCL